MILYGDMKPIEHVLRHPICQCCHRLLGKNQQTFEESSLDLRKITSFKFFALKFTDLLKMIQIFTLLPKNLYIIICKFVQILQISY